jgi:fatty acid CoA ligase FadD36
MPEPGAVEVDELAAHVAERLTAHKRPRRYHIVDALPRNGMGKVQKSKLDPRAPS